MTDIPSIQPNARRASKAALVSGLACFVLVLGVLLLHVGVSPYRVWESMQEGGWLMWVVLAGTLLLGAASLGYGLGLARRGRWPGWLLLFPPLLLPLVASAGIALAMNLVRDAISASSVDPSQRATIQAQGISEGLNLAVFGSWAACSLLCLAALLLGARALGRLAGAASAGRGLAVGGGAFVLALLAASVAMVLGLPILWGALVGALCTAAAAAMGTAALAADGAADNPDGHALALGDTLGAVFAGGAAIALGGLAARASGYSMVFGAVAAKSVDPYQKVEIIAQGYGEVRTMAWATLAFALPFAALLVLALLMRPRNAGKALARALPSLVVAIFVAVVPVALLGMQTGGLLPSFVKLMQPEPPPDVSLVVAAPTAQLDGAYGMKLYVGRESVQLDRRSIGKASLLDSDAGCDQVAEEIGRRHYLPVIAVDGTTPYRRMACLSRALRRVTSSRSRYSGDSRSDNPPNLLRWAVQQPGSGRKLEPPFDDLPPPQRALRSLSYTVVKGPQLVWARLSAGKELAPAGGDPLADAEAAAAWIRGQVDKGIQVHLQIDADVPATEVLAVLAWASRSDALPVVIGAALGEVADRQLDATDQRWLSRGESTPSQD